MTLVATPASATADSYLTVADADTLAAGDLAADPEVTRWLGAATTTLEKEQALRRATSQIDAALRSGWLVFDPSAQRVSGLIFPRAIDHTGSSPKVPYIPSDVKRATYEQAKYLLRNIRTIAAARARQARELQSASEPDVSYTESADSGGSEICAAAMHYLASFAQVRTPRGMRSVRMGARAFGADL